MKLKEALEMFGSTVSQLEVMYEDENVYSNMMSPEQWEKYKQIAEKALATIANSIGVTEDTYGVLALTADQWNDLERIMDNEQRIQEEESEFEERGPSPFLKSFFYMAYQDENPEV